MFIEIGFQKTPASICTRKEKRKKKKGTNLSQRLTDKRSEKGTISYNLSINNKGF
jgi:hypothetical protein